MTSVGAGCLSVSLLDKNKLHTALGAFAGRTKSKLRMHRTGVDSGRTFTIGKRTIFHLESFRRYERATLPTFQMSFPTYR